MKLRLAMASLLLFGASAHAQVPPPVQPAPGQPSPAPQPPGAPAPGTPPYNPTKDPAPSKPKPPKDKRGRIPPDHRTRPSGTAETGSMPPAESGARDGDRRPSDL